MRILSILALLLLSSVTFGKMPYDAVCAIDGKYTQGSGTLVAKMEGKGLILSEAHCFPKETEVTVTWGKQKRTAKPIYVSYAYDTALLVVENPPVEAVAIATTFNANKPLYLVGFPWYSREKLHYQTGTVEKFEQNNLEAYVTCRPAPAMSGGGVFNERGALIGSVKAVQKAPAKGGVIETNVIIYPILMAFADPETWVPITSHLRPNQKFNYAKREEIVTTEEYNEQSAPDLTPVETKASK